MALIKCGECDKEVSDKASSCPERESSGTSFTNWTYFDLTDKEFWQLLMETHPDDDLFQSAKGPIAPLHTHLFILADFLNIGSRTFKTLMAGKLLFSRLI